MQRNHLHLSLLIATAGALLSPLLHARTLAAGFVQADAAGGTTAQAGARTALSAGEENSAMEFEVVFNLNGSAELEGRVKAGEVLSRQDLEGYLPQVADYQNVRQWFINQGLTVVLDSETRHTLFLRGTVKQVAAALQTQFSHVSTADGAFVSADSAPSLPDAVATAVAAIRGLQPDRFVRHHHIHARPAGIDASANLSASVLNGPNAINGPAASGFADPATIAAHYQVPSTATGAGETIAIVGAAAPASSDISAFWTDCGVPQSLSRFTIVPISGGPAGNTSDAIELSMDVEWSSSIAPAASVRLYATSWPLTDVAEAEAYTQILNDLKAYPSIHETTESYGGPEYGGDNSFTLLEAQGVTCFASAGDGGSNPNFNDGGYYSSGAPLAVEYPASNPYVTAVGGTTLNLDSNGNLIGTETGWSLSQSSNDYAGGGGFSQVFTRPSWQVATGMPAGSARCVPDIAAIAWTTTGLYPFEVLDGEIYYVGGTSLASPICAGFCALINQNRTAQHLASVGALNALLYGLQGTTAFTDVTTGNNGAYNAGVGYDLVTGLGTPQVANLIAALSNPASNLPQITMQPQSQVLATGTSATLAVDAIGAATLTYQWSFKGTAIKGATASSYTITSFSSANAGSYTVVVANSYGSVTSSSATLSVGTAPVITTAPVSQSAVTGSSVSFSIVASGSPTLAYQWYYSSTSSSSYTAISGATSASATLANVQPSQSGSYAVQVSNAFGSAQGYASLSVLSPPKINSQPQSETVNPGSAASFTVGATGTALTYQWAFNGSVISGASQATYGIAAAGAGNAGTYAVVVSNAAGSVTSNGAVLTVNPAVAPVITKQPASLTVVSGGSFTLAVTASGVPSPAYAWSFNGTVIGGATGASVAFTGVTTARAGSYTVLVSNAAGSVTSQAAVVTVDTAPQITTQPASQSILPGAAVTFTVVASGIPSPAYQWYLGASALAGATQSSYSMVDVQPANAGSYVVKVTNTVGSVTSQTATLTVLEAPVITTAPAALTVIQGASASFSVGATGYPAPTYQWSLNGSAIAGATSAGFKIASAAPGNAGTYAVTVSNSQGSVTSTGALLTVEAPPSITTQPVGLTVVAGTSAVLSVAVASTTPVTYQWYLGSSTLAGATGASETLASAALGNAGSYTVKVTNVAGSVTSAAAVLTVLQAPVIATAPAALTVIQGASASFSVGATGYPAPTYQWSLNGSAIAGATSAGFKIASAAPGNAGTYAVAVSNSQGSVTSTGALLTVEAPPSITTQPVGLTVVAGTSAVLSVAVASTTPVTYQWYLGSSTLAGATGASETLASAALGNAGSYTVKVTNVAGSVTSAAAVLTVLQAPVIATAPAALTVIQGASASFSVGATGYPAPTYQWSLNGSAIAGATSAGFKIASAAPGNAGTYAVAVSNSQGSVTSTGALLTVEAPPSITTQPVGLTVVAGTSAVLSVAVASTTPVTYQWYLGSSTLAGATGASETLASAALGNAGSYTVKVTNVAGSVTSAAAVLTVLQAPVIATAPAALTVIQGASASFSVGATGYPAPTYQWSLNGSAIAGATSAGFKIASAAPGNAGTYAVTVSNSQGSVTSTGALLTVEAPPSITTQPVGLTVVAGTSAVLSVAVASTTPVTYQWYLGSSTLAGATGASETLASAALGNAGSYTVKVTNVAGSVTSAAAVLTVLQAPVIATAPAALTVIQGASASFSVGATGYPAPTYQWSLNGSAIAGATSAGFKIASAAPGNAGTYAVTVSNSQGSVTSTGALLTVEAPPSITTQPASVSVNANGSASFTVAVSSTTSVSYQWYFGTSSISKATGASYTISAASLATAGSYSVKVTNVAGSVTSSAAVLTVLQAPVITSAPPLSDTVNQGSTVTLTVVATAYPAPTYQWALNGTVIPGANQSTYVFNPVMAANTGFYTVTVANPLGSVTTPTVYLLVETPPSIVYQPVSQSTPVGNEAYFACVATASTPTVSYQWYFGSSAITGATSAVYSIASVKTTNAGNYTAKVSNVAGSVTSSVAVLTVTP